MRTVHVLSPERDQLENQANGEDKQQQHQEEKLDPNKQTKMSKADQEDFTKHDPSSIKGMQLRRAYHSNMEALSVDSMDGNIAHDLGGGDDGGGGGGTSYDDSHSGNRKFQRGNNFLFSTGKATTRSLLGNELIKGLDNILSTSQPDVPLMYDGPWNYPDSKYSSTQQFLLQNSAQNVTRSRKQLKTMARNS